MADLNHYLLSGILGSKIASIDRPRFGNFGLNTVPSDISFSNVDSRHRTQLTYKDDAAIVAAFEDVRDGAAPDAILWDVNLAEGFAQQAQLLGVDAPPEVICRRLINIRKNKNRYLSHGIQISPTTKNEPHPSVVPRYAHAIEFSLLRLRYLHGVSIDEILLNPKVGREFEALASKMAPSLTSVQLRLGALYIRKTRHFEKSKRRQLESLDPCAIETEWAPSLRLVCAHQTFVPAGPGLIEIKENSRYLYISRNEDLRSTIEQLATGPAIGLMSNHFWHPDLRDISVRFIAGREIRSKRASLWEQRLIQTRRPIFNWPILSSAA